MRLGIALAVWAGLLLAALLAAGTVTGDDSGALMPTATSIRLFVDDFETYSNRWRVVETPKAEVAYRDGALRFRIASPGVSIWSVPDFAVPLGVYRLQVSATVHAATPDSWFGIVVGYASDEQFTALALWPGGGWRLMRRDGGVWVTAASDDAARVDEIAVGAALDLSLDVGPDAVALAVDGRRAGEIPLDNGEFEGVFGLIAQSGKGYLDVSFDDIIVSGSARP
jgi:hypothetical protein